LSTTALHEASTTILSGTGACDGSNNTTLSERQQFGGFAFRVSTDDMAFGQFVTTTFFRLPDFTRGPTLHSSLQGGISVLWEVHRIPRLHSAAVVMTVTAALAVTATPASADGTITVSRRGVTVGISLPTNVDLGDADSAVDGTVVYAGADGESGAVVEALEDGWVRLQSVIADVTAEHDLIYELTVTDGARLEIVETGAVVVWDVDGDFEAGLAVADPWLGIALIDTVTRAWYSGQGYRYSVFPTWWGRGGAGR
jgi:hypothetical protein